MSSNRQKIKKQVKQHIPKDWLCDLRIAYRITMEAFNDIKRTGIINIVIITTMAAILTIFGALFRTTISMSQAAVEMGNILQISVYLKNDTSADNVKSKILSMDHVAKVSIIPTEESWKRMRRDLKLPNISNPLPDTLRVNADKPVNISGILAKIQTLPEVEDTGYDAGVAKKIQFLTHVINTTTAVVTIIVAMLTIMIINNTIQLVIQSRKDEIEIMRLMGVSNWYIKIPLVMQGAFYGLSGALIAIIPLNFVQNSLIKLQQFFVISSPPGAELFVIITLILVGILFGAGGSFISIKKHLQV